MAWPTMWYDLPLAVFDLETTGFDREKCQIIEIGIVQFLHGEVVNVYDWLIDPECEIPKDVVELTHIQQSDVDGQPKFAEIAPKVLEAFSGHGIVAYNVGFDRPFLTCKLEQLGMSWPSENPVIDPLVFASHFWPNQRNKLGMVAERLNVSLEGAHRACNDAEATGRVLYAMRDKLPPDLENLLIIQSQWDLENQERFRWRQRKNDTNGLNSLVSPTSTTTLGPSYFFGNETDPLRALYNMVPHAAPKTPNKDTAQ